MSNTRVVSGSCHCGKVRIEVDFDPSAGSGKCNCTICSKLRAWSTLGKPETVRLLSGAEHLSTYQWGGQISRRMFCKHCGVHVFARGHLPEVGGDFASVNLAVLDLAPELLASIPVRYFDGLHDNWEHPPAITSYL